MTQVIPISELNTIIPISQPFWSSSVVSLCRIGGYRTIVTLKGGLKCRLDGFYPISILERYRPEEKNLFLCEDIQAATCKFAVKLVLENFSLSGNNFSLPCPLLDNNFENDIP
jgi:hypothetical protein